jgi:polysaccharide deacetylase family protein (PEP-CTERM system associated)
VTGRPQASANALSVDVEDWFHDESRPAGPVTAAELAELEPRVEPNLRRLLAMFEARRTRATFFVLGDVAVRVPALVRAVAEAGHEVACHGWRHQAVGRRSEREFREDVRRARGAIEDIAGVPVRGFRAPCFIRRPEHLWALDVLAEEGYRYDSSYFPVSGWPGAAALLTRDRRPVRLPSGLWEFPLPLCRVATGHLLPLPAGGFVLRALPLFVTRRALRRFNAEVGPAVLYTHPWEIDPASGKLRGTPPHVRIFNGLGRRGVAGKLERLLQEFRFAPIAEVYAGELAGDREPASPWRGARWNAGPSRGRIPTLRGR